MNEDARGKGIGIGLLAIVALLAFAAIRKRPVIPPEDGDDKPPTGAFTPAVVGRPTVTVTTE